VVTTILLKGKKDQRSTNLVMIGGAYVFVLASIGLYLYKRDKKARKGEDLSISSVSDEGDFDVEGGILGIAPPSPPPIVENTPAKSVTRRILSPLKSFSSIRSLSPFTGFPSLRGKKLVAGNSVSISSGDSDVIPAIQESCSIDSSDTEDKVESKDSLDALMESSAPPDEQATGKNSGKLSGSSHPSSSEANAPRDSLDALTDEQATGKNSGKLSGSSHPSSSETNAPRDSLDALMENFKPQNEEIGQLGSIKPVGNHVQIGSASKAPRLAYEEHLISTCKNADFSFRDIFFDPENELYECRVPSGRLGIVVDETGLGPRVQKVNAASPLYEKISVGDIIIAVDEVDLVGEKPDTFWQLVSRKANKQERCIVVLKI